MTKTKKGITKVESDQLQLDGEGVDFVFACHNNNKNKKKKNKNPHIASAIRNGPTCLKFSSCPLGVLEVFEGCLVGVCSVSGWGPVGVLMVS